MSIWISARNCTLPVYLTSSNCYLRGLNATLSDRSIDEPTESNTYKYPVHPLSYLLLHSIMTSFKTFNINFPEAIGSQETSAEVALASIYGHFALVLPTDNSSYKRILKTLSTIVHEDPFPAPGSNDEPRFSMKTYSENAGLLEQLEALGVLRRTGISFKQGFVDIPVVEVCLDEHEIMRACAAHYEKSGAAGDCKLEVIGTRHPRCSGCKQVFYCDRKVCHIASYTRIMAHIS